VKPNEQSQACLSYAMARNGRIYTNLFQRLFVDGIQLITKLKNNMKGALISVSDKLLLRKRAIIETVYVSQNAVYQCTTYIRHTAESILNSSNSR
ncbi:transposase, partial [uncultured Prevotella sp.]|uniref:transposase n=1 Tax=uncultured Prevotella sp. TaxID=159272 RepID=UPI00338FB587